MSASLPLSGLQSPPAEMGVPPRPFLLPRQAEGSWLCPRGPGGAWALKAVRRLLLAGTSPPRL